MKHFKKGVIMLLNFFIMRFVFEMILGFTFIVEVALLKFHGYSGLVESYEEFCPPMIFVSSCVLALTMPIGKPISLDFFDKKTEK